MCLSLRNFKNANAASILTVYLEEPSAPLTVFSAASKSLLKMHLHDLRSTAISFTIKSSILLGFNFFSNAIHGNNSVILELRVVSPIPPDLGFTLIIKFVPSMLPTIGSTEEFVDLVFAVIPAFFNRLKISSLSVSLSSEETRI